MCQSAFVTKFAVSLDEPCTDVLLLPRLLDVMGEWTRRACCASADLEEFTRYMGEIFG
jgi:hypothetical protein